MANCISDNEFQFVDDYNKIDYITEFEYNMKMFLDVSFLKIGAWEDVDPEVEKCHDLATLRKVEFPDALSSNKNRIWVSDRKDWVWESSGIEFESESPFAPPEIYIDGDLVDSGEYEIDYQNGRVIFDEQKSSTCEVTAKYSFRKVQTYISDMAPWWQVISQTDYASNEELKTAFDNTLSAQHVQLPAIIIDTPVKYKTEPYCLGTKAQIFYHTVDFFVIANSKHTRNKIVSILAMQKNKRITLFNSDEVSEFPINCSGHLVNGDTYNEILASSGWKCANIHEIMAAEPQGVNEPTVNVARVRFVFEIFNPQK